MPQRGRSRSLVLPCSPRPCTLPRWPSGSSGGAAPEPTLPCGRTGIVQTLGSWLPYRALTAALVELATSSRGIRPAVRSETATCAAARFGRRPPLHRPRNTQACPGVRHRASTPTHVAVCFGPEENHPRNPVPSSWFRTTSTVSSARRSRACCIPLPVMGFAAFLESDSRSPAWQARPRREDRHPSSRRTSYPPKVSSTAAVPRHRGRCPRAVGHPSRSAPRSTPLPAPTSELHRTGASTSRRCSAFESGRRTIVADRTRPVLPWALFPFEALPDEHKHSCLRPRFR